MRKADIKENPLEIEKKAAEQREKRKMGYSLMDVRDQGGTVLSNGVRIHWGVKRREIPQALVDEMPFGIYVYPKYVPDNMMEIDGKLYDAEELRRYLRWA